MRCRCIKTYSSIQKLKVVQDCVSSSVHPPPPFHHYSDCGILTAERGTAWWSMTAVTIHTTERLGEKCNFLSSVELQKKGEEKEWTRQNYLPATTRACGNYYNDVSESRHSQCRDHTGADQKIKISGATVISLRHAKEGEMTERSALSSRWREVDG